MPRYIVSGSNNIDRIIPYEKDKPVQHAIGGGVNYALSAMSIFSDDVLSVSYAGLDFDEFYADWFRANGFSDRGVIRAFEKTYRTDLIYGEDGTFTTGMDLGENKYGRNTPNIDLLAPWLDDPELRGLHILSCGHVVLFQQLQRWREKGVKVGYEMKVIPSVYVDIIETIEGILPLVDYFSISMTEAKKIWSDVSSVEDAFLKFKDASCAVFLRAGTDGAYFIKDGKAYHSPRVSAFGDVDPTGCGNSSTAAAFVALCEGKKPDEIGCYGAVAASLAASGHGLVPKLTPEIKARCRELAQQLSENAEEGTEL